MGGLVGVVMDTDGGQVLLGVEGYQILGVEGVQGDIMGGVGVEDLVLS
jgi:hypothetical protein